MSTEISGRMLLFSVVAAAAVGCGMLNPSFDPPLVEPHSAIEADSVPWTGLIAKDSDSDFDFVVVTDRTGEHREGVFREAMTKVNLIQPAFVLSVGDLIEGYTDDPNELKSQWDEIGEMVSHLEMPFFYAAGNHDMSNTVMSEFWRERFGPSYYSFSYKDVLFVVLNSELFGMVSDPGRSVPGPESQAEQMEWLESVLSEESGRRYSFIIVHQPLWDRPRQHPDWAKVEEWLGTRPYTVLAGHMHAYTKHTRHDRQYITLATTGGGSGLRGLKHGEFDHVMLISMREEGPVLANLLLDGIQDENVRTAETRERLASLSRALKAVPQSATGVSFSDGAVEFEITNPAPETLKLKVDFRSAGNLEVMTRDLEEELAPGERMRFSVKLRARSGAQDLRDTAIPLAHWRLEGVDEAGAPLVVERDAWLLPRGKFRVPRALRGIQVDGRLEDWSSLPFRAVAPAGSGSHAEFRFGVAHDESFFYLAVDVQDSTPVHSGNLIGREQDSIQFNLDARADPERSVSGRGFFESAMDGTLQQLVIGWLTPVEPVADGVIERWLPSLPSGTLQSSQQYEGGYTIELAIPSGWLDERQGKPWEVVRIDLSVQDFAHEGGHPTSIRFRPARFDQGGALAIPGSGTFERSMD